MLLAGLAGELNEEQKEYLKTILEKGEASWADPSILDLSRIEARGVQLDRRLTNMGDLVQNAMESVVPQSFKKKLRLVTELAPNLPKVIIDADKIRQCVVNLLSNAVKFTPAGGQITVRASLAERAPANAGPFGAAGYFRDLGRRQRHRHPARAAAQGVRDLLPGRLERLARIRRRGPGALHRQELRRRARRRGLARQRAGQGQRLHAGAADRAALGTLGSGQRSARPQHA